MNGMEARAADIWWAMLSAKRKVQIHRWVEPEPIEHPTAGQYEIPGVVDPDEEQTEAKQMSDKRNGGDVRGK